jgi:hypothetical protein
LSFPIKQGRDCALFDRKIQEPFRFRKGQWQQEQRQQEQRQQQQKKKNKKKRK